MWLGLAALLGATFLGNVDVAIANVAGPSIRSGTRGFSLPKPAWLARHGRGLRYDAFDVEETQARSYGEVAVVTGRHVQHGTFAGNPIPEAVQATHVLVRDGGRWRLAALGRDASRHDRRHGLVPALAVSLKHLSQGPVRRSPAGGCHGR